MRRFTFLKSTTVNGGYKNNTMEEIKNTSLPKTASTMNQNRTETTIESDSRRKQTSKELLSQIHFCRFIYKLLQRIEGKMNGEIGSRLKENMWGLVFSKLDEIVDLNYVSTSVEEYRKSNDYKKICQIVNQY
jgi:hypothetical protein